MHKTQCTKHAAHWGFDQPWAEKRWLDAKAATPEDKWDYQGPDEALRLPMPTENYNIGFIQSSHGKIAGAQAELLIDAPPPVEGKGKDKGERKGKDIVSSLRE